MGGLPRAGKSYGQFCPVARGAEIVAERWTPLVLRELLMGSHRFADLRRGLPAMSPSLLSRRLTELEDAGVIERRPRANGAGHDYYLTAAGQALRPIIELIGIWGHRWSRSELRDDELDPALLMWDVRRCVRADQLPDDQRVVVQFEIAGVPVARSRYWLVFDRGQVDLCIKPPGYDVDLEVSAHIRPLVDVWVGRTQVDRAVGETIELRGPRRLVRSFSRWFGPSAFAQLAARTP